MQNDNKDESISLKVSSPSIERRRLEQDLDIHEKEYDNTWQSCCCGGKKTDKRLLQYVTRFSLSILVLVFASVQLINSGECDSLNSFYISLISMIVGVWVNPMPNDKKNIKN